MNEEIARLDGMQRWSLSNRPTKEKVLHSKFVLRRKKNRQGDVVKYKTRLVVCGNEEDGFHDECFAPVADFTTAKMVMCIFLQQGPEPSHIDFDNKFCYQRLEPRV